MILRFLSAVLAGVLCVPCFAKTTEVSPAGFLSSFHEEVDAAPAAAWIVLTQVAHWWGAQHTYSGDAANLTLEATAGGCWCERWKGNSVEHMRVLVAMPPSTLRLEGGLGPLQAMAVNAVLTFRLTPHGAGTALDVTYRVRAASDAALDRIADPVDHVLEEQVKRLAASLRKP